MNRRKDQRVLVLITVLMSAVSLGYILQRVSLKPHSAKSSEVMTLKNSGRTVIEEQFYRSSRLLQAKHYDLALDELKRLMKSAPRMPEAYVNTGYALIGLRQFDQAVGYFQSALRLNRQQINAYYGLALGYEGLEDLESALGAMKTYVHLAGKDDAYSVKAWSAIWEWQNAKNAESEATP